MSPYTRMEHLLRLKYEADMAGLPAEGRTVVLDKADWDKQLSDLEEFLDTGEGSMRHRLMGFGITWVDSRVPH